MRRLHRWIGDRKKEPEETEAMRLVRSPEYERIRRLYAQYCVGMAKTYEAAYNDFPNLCTLPGVAHVGFEERTKTLLVGTEMVYLSDRWGQEYEIGEFLIYIQRPEHILFENISRTVPNKGCYGDTFHPHIMTGPENGPGTICMPSGRDAMIVALKQGDLVRATSYALAGLHTYTPGGNPYSPIEYWPRRKNNAT